jgi:hypothetical protein
MKWESTPADFDFVVPAESFNTPGNEVTPRSNVIRKQLKGCLFGHQICSTCFKARLKKVGAHGDWAPEQRKELRVKLKSKPTNHYSNYCCMYYSIYHDVACQGLN